MCTKNENTEERKKTDNMCPKKRITEKRKKSQKVFHLCMPKVSNQISVSKNIGKIMNKDTNMTKS